MMSALVPPDRMIQNHYSKKGAACQYIRSRFRQNDADAFVLSGNTVAATEKRHFYRQPPGRVGGLKIGRCAIYIQLRDIFMQNAFDISGAGVVK
jgi:hypothetical protein